jgi:hypothetical protein
MSYVYILYAPFSLYNKYIIIQLYVGIRDCLILGPVGY